MDTRQKLALQVPEVPEDFNPDFSVFPESAEEYLKSVIYQRRHIPDVVKIDPANFPFSTRVRPVVEVIDIFKRLATFLSLTITLLKINISE